MRLPKPNEERILVRDKYRSKVLLHGNQSYGFDLQTDGRILLSTSVARKLAAALLDYARTREAAP